MVPISQIRNPEVREFADEALRFLESHSWCGPVRACETVLQDLNDIKAAVEQG